MTPSRLTEPRWVLGIAVTLLMSVLILRSAISQQPQVAAVGVLVLVVVAIFVAARMVVGRSITLGSVYLLLFGLFHAGLLPYIATNQTPTALLNGVKPWWHLSTMGMAIGSVGVSVLAFLIGYSAFLTGYPAALLTRLRQRGKKATVQPAGGVAARLAIGIAARPAGGVAAQSVERDEGDSGGDHPPPGQEERTRQVGILGFVLLVAGVLLWFANTPGQGLGFVTLPYLDFRDGTDDNAMAFANLFTGIGMGALGLAPSAVLRRWGLVVFIVFAIPAFLVGLRGEVIFPLAAWLVTTARRRHIQIRWWMGPLLLAGLSAGSIIRQLRDAGLSAARFGDIQINPLDGLAELGASIRPLVLVHQWHDGWGESFVGWGTYWAPLQRILFARLLGLDAPSVHTDARVFSTTIADRVGAIGGSPAAEAYRAAGLIGIIVVLALLGMLVAWLDTRPAGSIGDHAIGMLGYILLVWVRNDFSPVVVSLAACILALAAVYLVHAQLNRRRSGLVVPTIGQLQGQVIQVPSPGKAGLETRIPSR
ncbi:O-antigen polysaccharide polymerase Wzy [Micromonospora sp. NPDC003197]